MGDERRVVEEVFREESGKIVAGLIRQYGDFDLAEDALQDAFLAALDRWAADGTPDNPGAWITTTARRKAIDRHEGYSASTGDTLIRRDLCAEAIRLARLLADLMPAEPETHGLLALLLLQDSRREARVGPKGQLITLEEQDRSLWDRGRITEGLHRLQQAIELRCEGPYQVQAAIAAVHAQAKTADDTDWKEIASLYAELARIHPSPVVELNRAVAVAMSDGYEAGLSRIDRLGASGELDNYHLYHAARAAWQRCRSEDIDPAQSRLLMPGSGSVPRGYDAAPCT